MSSYKLITKHGHPNAKANGGVYEHVFVMSEMLGRALYDGEVVHHIDENKGNNSPKNLQLFATVAEHNSHHRHLRAMQECGNPGYRKCPLCKTYDDPKNMVQRREDVHSHKACIDLYNATSEATPEGKARIKARNDARRATPKGKAKANAATAKSIAKKKLLLTQLEKLNHDNKGAD